MIPLISIALVIRSVFRSSNYSYRSRTFSYDYEREETRKYVFMALISSFNVLSENVIVSNGINKYLNIPQNKVVFYDFIYKTSR
jgi:hypothetical protein